MSPGIAPVSLTTYEHQLVLQIASEILTAPAIDVKQICEQFNFSFYKLNGGFKQIFYTTIKKYQYEARISQARTLLSSTNKPVKEICFICGFKNYHSFHRAFKKATGKPPALFRMQTEMNFNSVQ